MSVKKNSDYPTPTQRNTLKCLVSLYAESGISIPSEDMAKALGIPVNHVRNRMRDYAKKGWVNIFKGEQRSIPPRYEPTSEWYETDRQFVAGTLKKTVNRTKCSKNAKCDLCPSVGRTTRIRIYGTFRSVCDSCLNPDLPKETIKDITLVRSNFTI